MQVTLVRPATQVIVAKKDPAEALLALTLGRVVKVIQNKKDALEVQSAAIRTILAEALDTALTSEETELKDRYIAELEAGNQKLLEQIDRISQQHDKLKSKFRVLQVTTKDLKQKQTDLSVAYAATEKDNAQLKVESAAHKVKYEDLGAKHKALKAAFDKLSTQNVQLVSKTAELATDYTELEAEYELLSEENEGLKSETSELQQKFEKLDTQYDGLEDHTQNLRSKFDLLQKQYTQLQNFLKGVIATNAKLQNEIDEQAKKADEIGEQFDHFSQSLKTLKAYIWCAVPHCFQTLIQIGKRLYDSQKATNV